MAFEACRADVTDDSLESFPDLYALLSWSGIENRDVTHSVNRDPSGDHELMDDSLESFPDLYALLSWSELYRRDRTFVFERADGTFNKDSCDRSGITIFDNMDLDEWKEEARPFEPPACSTPKKRKPASSVRKDGTFVVPRSLSFTADAQPSSFSWEVAVAAIIIIVLCCILMYNCI
jgi:hypothetical protein